jgi:hypothetical protein
MATIFMLSHVHEFEDGHEDLKIIGFYSSQLKAEEALAKVRDQSGFKTLPESFSIDEWRVDPEHPGWSEGYVTTFPDGTFSE